MYVCMSGLKRGRPDEGLGRKKMFALTLPFPSSFAVCWNEKVWGDCLIWGKVSVVELWKESKLLSSTHREVENQL